MENHIRQALAQDGIIDITTTGRKSGRPHRIETGLFRADGKLYLSGFPGARDWFANLKAHPRFTIHLKQSASADISASGTPVTDPQQRQTVLASIVGKMGRVNELEAWVAASPLVAIEIDGFIGES